MNLKKLKPNYNRQPCVLNLKADVKIQQGLEKGHWSHYPTHQQVFSFNIIQTRPFPLHCIADIWGWNINQARKKDTGPYIECYKLNGIRAVRPGSVEDAGPVDELVGRRGRNI
jgi:hypothetical protein